MMTAAIVVSLVAMSGWLYLNWRALESHGLSLERKALFAAVWVALFVGLAFLFTRLGA
jgi:hypothetical protein